MVTYKVEDMGPSLKDQLDTVLQNIASTEAARAKWSGSQKSTQQHRAYLEKTEQEGKAKATSIESKLSGMEGGEQGFIAELLGMPTTIIKDCHFVGVCHFFFNNLYSCLSLFCVNLFAAMLATARNVLIFCLSSHVCVCATYVYARWHVHACIYALS